jgi:hypothetical protein
VIVDSVTYIACAGLGLTIDGESIPYVAGWAEDGALDAVNRFATTIDRLPPDRERDHRLCGYRFALSAEPPGRMRVPTIHGPGTLLTAASISQHRRARPAPLRGRPT